MTPELADGLYEALGGEIEFNIRDGVAWLEVERSARSFREAIELAIAAVHDASLGVRVSRVETEASRIVAQINAELQTSGGV
ncbi:MAG: hypothetical protein ACREJB_19485 [Planctomycetaceae bacterium]